MGSNVNENHSQHFLIVGQGLAGTLLSYFFRKNNISHDVIDNNHKSASTKVAAGLINPITGRKYVKSWRIDELLPFAQNTYREMEQLLGVQLIYKNNILRTLKSPTQINDWDVSSSRLSNSHYIQDDPNGRDYVGFLKEECKFGEIKNSMRVDISLLIKEYKNHLQIHNQYIESQFDYASISFQNGKTVYKFKEYNAIIFCEGHQATNNPYFKDLGFQLAKGQALSLYFPNFHADKILRDDIFFSPIGQNTFWSGGGYQWSFNDEEPTDEWFNEWKEKIENITDQTYEVKDFKAGIRPCVKDRKPLLGRHPIEKKLFIFNGLGTKGTSLGPFFANQMFQFMFENEEIDQEVDIKRYTKD